MGLRLGLGPGLGLGLGLGSADRVAAHQRIPHDATAPQNPHHWPRRVPVPRPRIWVLSGMAAPPECGPPPRADSARLASWRQGWRAAALPRRRFQQATATPTGKERHSAVERSGVGPARDEGAVERVPPAHDDADRPDRRRVLRSHGTHAPLRGASRMRMLGGHRCTRKACTRTRVRMRLHVLVHAKAHTHAHAHARQHAHAPLRGR